MTLVGGPAAELHTQPRHEAGEHVAEGVDGIGDHGGGVTDQTPVQLEGRQKNIAADAHGGDFSDDPAFVHATASFREKL